MARDDLVGGPYDGLCVVVGQEPQVPVHERARLLEDPEGVDHLAGEALAPDAKVLERALGLRAPVPVGRHLDAAHRVLLDPRRRHGIPPGRPRLSASSPSHSIGRGESIQMDCCAHEGPAAGDARFDFERVADGVHVAVAAPAYKVNSNTAIIESDDGVVIVDTHSKPSAARVIVDRVRDITSKPVRFVVNTHFHWDHWHGNEVYPAAYPGAEIITNQLTREAMVRKGLKRIQDHVRQVPAEVSRLQ